MRWGGSAGDGLERGEALGLRWTDVDLTAGRVHITKALSRVGKGLALRDVKTESSPWVEPSPVTVDN